MKSNSPTNVNNTSEGPKFKIGDLVCHTYQKLVKEYSAIGLVTNVVKVDYGNFLEVPFVDYFYEYDVLWADGETISIMFEIFLKKYEYEK